MSLQQQQQQQQQQQSVGNQYLQVQQYRFLSQLLLILLGIIYIILCPYNKVEESFNIQATHDLYYYGIFVPTTTTTTTTTTTIPSPPVTAITTNNTTNGITTTLLINDNNNNNNNSTNVYDHLKYPGVVPRTFLGPFIISSICQFLRYSIWLVTSYPLQLYNSYYYNNNNPNHHHHNNRYMHVSATSSLGDISNYPHIVQFLARLILLLFNISQLLTLVSSLDRFVELVSSSLSSLSVSSITTTGNRTPTIIGTYMIFITCCQFHSLYYYSRMLPNTFACIATLRCYVHWLNALCLSYNNTANVNNNDNRNSRNDSITGTTGSSNETKDRKQHHRYEMIGAIIDLLIATLIFRCDCILLVVTIGLSWIITKQLSIFQCITFGSAVSIVLVFGITIPLDSLLWQRFVWPEGEVFYYNTILNKSSNWGVSAWHWYFTSALPKALLLPIFFIPLSFIRIPEILVTWERRLRLRSDDDKSKTTTLSYKRFFDTTYPQFLLPALGFVVLYSNLGHKEVRFLYPVLPLFNMCAAIGLYRIHEVRFPIKDKLPTMISKVLYVFAILALIVSFLASGIFVAISRFNYPGGDALQLLTNHVNEIHATNMVTKNDVNTLHVKVHIDVASAMTGVNLFGQRAASVSNPNIVWSFDKDGYEIENHKSQLNWSLYTHLLSESKDMTHQTDDFIVVGVAPGNPRLDVRRGKIVTSDAIYVLERKDWINDSR